MACSSSLTVGAEPRFEVEWDYSLAGEKVGCVPVMNLTERMRNKQMIQSAPRAGFGKLSAKKAAPAVSTAAKR